MDISYPLRIGTRSSALALTQTELFCQALRAAVPACVAAEALEITPMTTSGDTLSDRPLYDIGGKALFCRELDAALLAGLIDVAVHSLKDIPAQLDERLLIAAVLPRADCRDALISQDGQSLMQLKAGARIGTCSLRRQAQILALRPDLKPVPMRGNVPSRIEKWRACETDALILAYAGLLRLQRTREVTDILAAEDFVPAGGQGMIALVTAKDSAVCDLVAAVNHAPSMAAATLERLFLQRIGGSCHTPVGIHAADGRLRAFLGSVASPGLITRAAVPATEAAAAIALAEQMLREAPPELLREAGLRT